MRRVDYQAGEKVGLRIGVCQGEPDADQDGYGEVACAIGATGGYPQPSVGAERAVGNVLQAAALPADQPLVFMYAASPGRGRHLLRAGTFLVQRGPRLSAHRYHRRSKFDFTFGEDDRRRAGSASVHQDYEVGPAAGDGMRPALDRAGIPRPVVRQKVLRG